MISPPLPVMLPITDNVVPAAWEKVPVPVSDTDLTRLKVPVVARVPPLSVSEPVPPRLLSADTSSVPAETVVPPV